MTLADAQEIRITMLEDRAREDRESHKDAMAGFASSLGRIEDKLDAQVARAQWTPAARVGLVAAIAGPMVGALALVLGAFPGAGVGS